MQCCSTFRSAVSNFQQEFGVTTSRIPWGAGAIHKLEANRYLHLLFFTLVSCLARPIARTGQRLQAYATIASFFPPACPGESPNNLNVSVQLPAGSASRLVCS
ncbi:unnamed protein product [Prorocentrum cordatum]|uniref:Uncharacterized protein n=1 Tax=Prorocentrum cordatum TaxID=2364126 RepID=A0ABN9VIG3_9DINO|nr:unnamed protein product [Polarella glacialis]